MAHADVRHRRDKGQGERLSETGKKPTPGKASRGLPRIMIRLVGPVLLVIVLFRIGDLRRLGEVFAGATLWPVVAAMCLNVFTAHFKVLRWRILLEARGYAYGLGRAWTAFLASVYLGLITPGRVGDMLRIQYTRHDIDVPYPEGLAVTVMDRFCDMYVLLAFAAVGIANFSSILSGKLAYVTWIGVGVTALAPAALLIPGVADPVMRHAYGLFAKDKQAVGIDEFLSALRAQLGRPLLLAVPLTAAAFLLNYVQGWLLTRALGLQIAFFDVMCMLAITSLLSLLPISVSGIGVRELFLALVFTALGHSPEQGIAFGLCVFAVLYLFFVAIGFVSWQLAPPPVASGKDVSDGHD